VASPVGLLLAAAVTAAPLASAAAQGMPRFYVVADHNQQVAARASHDDYDESIFPTGLPVGTCQDALDTACGLYLNDPTAWS
jgi:hypothetical protein